MTISARRRLLLRRVVRKRPAQHSCWREWAGPGLQKQAFSSEWPLGLGIAPRFRHNGDLGGGKGEIPDYWDFAKVLLFGIFSRKRTLSSRDRLGYFYEGRR